jgi:hypothetical protein
MPKKSFSSIIKALDIDETFTRPRPEQKQFNHIKNNIPLVANYNYMADILFLPTSKEGFKYLLVMVDLATDAFDVEPLKSKSAEAVLAGMLRLFKRKYLKKPYASIRTDSGSEFQSVFHKYLYDNSILHKVALPNRHKQLANVESLNRTLGRLINGYLVLSTMPPIGVMPPIGGSTSYIPLMNKLSQNALETL